MNDFVLSFDNNITYSIKNNFCIIKINPSKTSIFNLQKISFLSRDSRMIFLNIRQMKIKIVFDSEKKCDELFEMIIDYLTSDKFDEKKRQSEKVSEKKFSKEEDLLTNKSDFDKI
jgi:hypothetical protein